MMAEDSYCSCSTTAPDDNCSCDRPDVHGLDLATSQFEVVIRQPSQTSDCSDKPQSSKRSQRAYSSMTVQAGKTNDEVRKQFTGSAEALHRSSADGEYCDGRPPTPEQRSRSSELTAVGPEAPNLLRTTDPQALPDIFTTELQVAATDQQLRESDFCATDDPPTAQFYTNDFRAVIMPNASDDFDAVDLTVDDYRPRSFDVDSWGDRGSTIDSVQARSLESGTWGIGVQQMTRDVRKENGSLWTRIKNYICDRLCFRRR
ncbi:unnamed protein product [Aphis gossypii]|uniref:Uncharacterized protein n=1 Tax=Aphis gossypii TaxID=80765 RepID=A0A9P0IXQ3_APHGO|nr:unnamed protein product [Aphis gossypii]